MLTNTYKLQYVFLFVVGRPLHKNCSANQKCAKIAETSNHSNGDNNEVI